MSTLSSAELLALRPGSVLRVKLRTREVVGTLVNRATLTPTGKPGPNRVCLAVFDEESYQKALRNDRAMTWQYKYVHDVRGPAVLEVVQAK